MENIDELAGSISMTLVGNGIERFKDDKLTTEYIETTKDLLVEDLKVAKDGEEMENRIRTALLHAIVAGWGIGKYEGFSDGLAWSRVKDGNDD